MSCTAIFTPGTNPSPDSQSWDISSTSTCYTFDAKACPSGGIPSNLTQHGWSGDISDPTSVTMAVTCSYTPSGLSLNTNTFIGDFGSQGADLPQPFIDGMLKRYAVQKFICGWNSEIYGVSSENTQSDFHRQVDIGDVNGSDSFRQNVAMNAIAPVMGYTKINQTDMMNMLTDLSQYPLLTQNQDMGMYLYVLGTPNLPKDLTTNVIGMTSYPSNVDLTNQFQLFTTETTSNSTIQQQPQLGPPQNPTPFNYPSSGIPLDILTNPYYIFVDLNNYIVYNVNVTSANLRTLGSVIKSVPNGDFYVVGRIYVCPVIKLSPVLAYMFNLEYPNIFSTETGAQRVIADTGMVPEKYYEDTCLNNFTDQCKTYMMTYCDFANKSSYLNPGLFPGIAVSLQRFFMSQMSDACQCYNSLLMPPFATSDDRDPAMCFTSACTSNPQILSAFGLTPGVCANFCPTVGGWISSLDQKTRSSLGGYLDSGKFEQLCPNLSIAAPTVVINKPIGITGICVTIAAAFVVYIILKRRGTRTQDIIIATTFTLLVSGAISAFMAFFTNGVPVCDYLNKRSGCTTPIGNLSLPGWCCSNKLYCECFDQGGCLDTENCFSGICVPK